MPENFNAVTLLTIVILSIWSGYIIGVFRRRRVENGGEAMVTCYLKEYCKNRNAHILNCITLRLEDGSTTQIDHILVSTKGVFVIETKHYKGWVFGNSRSKKWAQIIFKNKYLFQNPMRQNYKHVKEVERVFDFLERRVIHNIVVFSGEAIFKTPRINGVYYLDELIPAIEKCSDGALTLNCIQFCVGRIEYMRLKLTEKTDVEHQEYLERKFG